MQIVDQIKTFKFSYCQIHSKEFRLNCLNLIITSISKLNASAQLGNQGNKKTVHK